MAKILNSVYEMRLLEEYAGRDTFIYRIHPVSKLMVTLVYLFTVISYDRFEILALLPLFLYPVILFALADIPWTFILKKLILIEPLIIGIGILNPLFDPHTVIIGGMVISRGWITFLSIIIKSILALTAALLLIATTGMDKLGMSMRILKVPRIFVLQLLLTYRYISVLLEELSRLLRAYELRSVKQKGIQRNVWGPMVGQLLIRTYDRALRVYQAMCLRGFTGEYHTGKDQKMGAGDLCYLVAWAMFFLTSRFINIPLLLGSWTTGVMK